MFTTTDTGKVYHTQCTGEALRTAQTHSADAPYTLFASCFCPFVQRAWVALEHLRIHYKHLALGAYNRHLANSSVDEIDLYKKPPALLEISPKGLVPALRLNEHAPPRALNESTIIVEFLDELAQEKGNGRSLLPPLSDPYARTLIRLQVDHISRTLVPSFYRYLQAQGTEKQDSGDQELRQSLDALVSLFERAEKELGGDKNLRKYLGLWVEDGEMNLADVIVGPWIFRMTNVLKHYRGFELPAGDKFVAWVGRLINHPSFKATCSTEKLYIDSYEKVRIQQA